MKVTNPLKQWLVDNRNLSADASEDEVKQAAAGAMVDGGLTPEKMMELTKDSNDDEADSFTKRLDQVLEALPKISDRLDAIERGADGGEGNADDKGAGDDGSGTGTLKKDGVPDTKTVKSYFEKICAGAGGDDGGVNTLVHVKGAHEQYGTTRSEAFFPTKTARGRVHPNAGQRLFEGGAGQPKRFIDAPSELDGAINGAYAKFVISSDMGKKTPRQFRMTEHDMDLMQYALRKEKWVGVIGGECDSISGAEGVKTPSLLNDRQIKAVLDDATSGGLELAPIMFDDAIIRTPLLTGEFFPFVNVVPVTRGRRIEGGSISNVTLTSGGADGTSIPLFSTASFISAFDTSIFVVNGAIEIGLDFLSDSPVDVASVIMDQYGLVLLNWLDEQITVGDGTTEPEGIMNASGTTSVGSANGAGGPPTVGDYEGLLFGVAKQFKTGHPTNRVMYGANETTYQRSRSVAVGGTDQRRVFGMTHEDYMLLGHPYGIGGSMTNSQSFFGVMPRYRMYRRMGLSMKSTTEGKELTRDNLMLITARARFGGQVEDGAAFAVMTDNQS